MTHFERFEFGILVLLAVVLAFGVVAALGTLLELFFTYWIYTKWVVVVALVVLVAYMIGWAAE